MDKQKLIDRIIEVSTAYYEGNQDKLDQVITDSEFDDLVDQLRLIDKDHYILKTPGWGYKPKEKSKSNHLGETVGSLDKTTHPDELPENYTHDVTLTPKLDGCSIVLYYSNKELIKALTRGDGKEGKVCTEKMKYILNKYKIKTDILPDGLFSVRGECIIPLEYEQTLKDRGIPSPRNYASGIMNRDEISEDLNMIEFIPYSIRMLDNINIKYKLDNGVESSIIANKKYYILHLLDILGFKPILFMAFTKELTKEHLEYQYSIYEKYYPIDGLVITRNELNFKGNNIIELSHAYKFEGETASVRVGDVIWNIGGTGRAIPVIHLETPIFLSNSNIENITAHNAAIVRDLGIGKGAIITISRAGDVIPYLKEVNESVEPDLIERCPLCGFTLDWESVHLVCNNYDCPAKQDAIKENIIKIAGIPDGLGPETIKKWHNNLPINEFFRVCNSLKEAGEKVYEYRLLKNQSIFGNHYGTLITKLERNISRKFKDGFEANEFWLLSNINGLGESWADKLKFNDPRNISIDDIKELSLAVNIKEELLRTFDRWKELTKQIPINDVDYSKNVEPAFMIAVTGKLSMKRKDFEKLLTSYNIKLGNISKDTKYLICNNPSSSNKSSSALKYGIPILTEFEFIDLISPKKN